MNILHAWYICICQTDLFNKYIRTKIPTKYVTCILDWMYNTHASSSSMSILHVSVCPLESDEQLGFVLKIMAWERQLWTADPHQQKPICVKRPGIFVPNIVGDSVRVWSDPCHYACPKVLCSSGTICRISPQKRIWEYPTDGRWKGLMYESWGPE